MYCIGRRVWGYVMRALIGSLWRRYVVDECPDARWERLHTEIIARARADHALSEAFELWELERRRNLEKLDPVREAA